MPAMPKRKTPVAPTAPACAPGVLGATTMACPACRREASISLPSSAAERGRGMSVNTVDLRRAAIRYLHYIAGLAVPTAEALVGETMPGIHRQAADAGEMPARKVAASAGILRQILAPIPDDLPGLRDRALLLVGFTGALRRAELAAIRVEHLEMRERGFRLTLPHSKGERTGRSVTIAIPHGSAGFCPVRGLRRWLEAAEIRDGAVFRRIWVPPAGRNGSQNPLPRLGIDEIDPWTVARIIQKRAAASGFSVTEFGGHWSAPLQNAARGTCCHSGRASGDARARHYRFGSPCPTPKVSAPAAASPSPFRTGRRVSARCGACAAGWKRPKSATGLFSGGFGSRRPAETAVRTPDAPPWHR